MPYFADLYVEQSADQYTKDDWRIAVGDQQPGGESFSFGRSEASIQVWVPWNKRRSFLRFILGWSYADRSSPYRLRRELPQYHPSYSFMRATGVQFQGVAPSATYNVGSKVAGAFANALPEAKYQKILATVQFAAQPWTYLFDEYATTPQAEATRYTYFDPAPSVEVISAEGLNNIKFANGPSAGVAIPAPFGTLMSKTLKTLNWREVPHEYLSGSDTLQFTPSKIDAVVGHVNSDTFLGHPPGTLLLQAPQYERFQFPFMSAGGTYNYFGWNVKLPMQFFDPPQGYDSGTLAGTTITLSGGSATKGIYLSGDPIRIVGSGGTKTTTIVSFTQASGTIGISDAGGISGAVTVYADGFRGHQSVPRRDDLLWYGAIRQDESSKLYPETDFASIFQHVSDPTTLS